MLLTVHGQHLAFHNATLIPMPSFSDFPLLSEAQAQVLAKEAYLKYATLVREIPAECFDSSLSVPMCSAFHHPVDQHCFTPS